MSATGILTVVRLVDVGGHGVTVQVVGYQFPEADNPGQHFSWHLVEGDAACTEGAWSFRYPALTCDESPRLAAWLREVAQEGGSASVADQDNVPRPAPLTFTEPNLSLAVVRYGPATVVIDVGLDLEFAPPWWSRRTAGDPYLIRCELAHERLIQAATDWELEIAPFPDH